MKKWIESDYREDFSEAFRQVVQKSKEYKQIDIVEKESEFSKLFNSVQHGNLNEGVIDSIKGTIKNTFDKDAKNKNKVDKKTLVNLGVSEKNISENMLGSEKVYTISGDWDISGRDELDLSVIDDVRIVVKGKFDCSETSISSFEKFPTITCTDFIFKNGKSQVKSLVGSPVAKRNIELDGTKLSNIVGLQLTNSTEPVSISGNLILANTGLTNISIKSNENGNTLPEWVLKVGGILDITNCFPISNINWFVDSTGKGIVSRQVKYNIDELVYNKLSTDDKSRFDKLIPTKVSNPIDRIDFISHLKLIRKFHKDAVEKPVVGKVGKTGAKKPAKKKLDKAPIENKIKEEPVVEKTEDLSPNSNISIDLSKLGKNRANLQNIILGVKNAISNKNLELKLSKLKEYATVIGNPDLDAEITKMEKLISNAHLEKINSILDNLLEKSKYVSPNKKDNSNTNPVTEEQPTSEFALEKAVNNEGI